MKTVRPQFVRSINALIKLLEKQLSGRRYVLLTDENVSESCLPLLGDFLAIHVPLDVIEVEAGEACKSPEVCLQLWRHLIELEFSKSDVLVCLGGGSVTDLGGFIASTYKRGIPFIYLPTTLLAMTDAAIGGKNGVDMADVKNVIGVISQPMAINIYPGFNDSLSDRQWLSGMAEVAKHGVIAGGELWAELQLMHADARTIPLKVLKKSVLVKHAIVREDMFERGRRMVLNFGHTIGHAIESVYMQKGNPIEHGLAVVMGMLVEVKLAINLNVLSPKCGDEITNFLVVWFRNEMPVFPQFHEIAPFLNHDKKVFLGKNVLFLPTAIGDMKKHEFSSLTEFEEAYNQVIDFLF